MKNKNRFKIKHTPLGKIDKQTGKWVAYPFTGTRMMRCGNKFVKIKVTDAIVQDIVPKNTEYCYEFKDGKFNMCPFLDFNNKRQHQMDGYCHLLRTGDWVNNHMGLLWDSCKSCGVNSYEEELDNGCNNCNNLYETSNEG